MNFRPFSNKQWFHVHVTDAARRYPPQMPPMIAGVYAIADAKTGAILYVGESHGGQLRKTIANHFQRPPWTSRGQVFPTYDRNKVQVAWHGCAAH